MTGSVTRYLDLRGFGFIRRDDDGTDVFFHIKQCRDRSHLYRAHERVEFETEVTGKGVQAVDVQLLPIDDTGDECQTSR